LVLAGLFVGTDLLAMRRVSQLRVETEQTEQNVLTNLEAVSTMHHDLDLTKLLVDRHIFVKSSETMAALDARIRETQADFDRAATQYESMPMLPGEQVRWKSLGTEIASLEPRFAAVLALSRRNEDSDAARILTEMQGDIERADDDLRALGGFYHQAARESVDRVAALERSAAVGLFVLSVSGVVLSTILGIALTRIQRMHNLQLGRAVDKLEASNRELDAFAGRVAHDLRGPLTTATLATSKLAKQLPGHDQAKALGARSSARSARWATSSRTC
jgi:hypothetical protein